MLATEYFNALLETAIRETTPDEEASVSYSLSGLTFEIRSSIPSLIDDLVPALGHSQVNGTQQTDLVVRVHRGRASKLGLPDPESLLDEGVVTENRGVVNPVIYFSDENTQGVFKRKTGTFSFFSHREKQAVHWLADSKDIPLFERDRPLREILKWWLGAHGLMVLHAACISRAGVGVLLVGPSGAGKSSIALACLQSDFQYLGDEYVLVSRDTAPTAFCLYSSGRLSMRDAHRYPHLAALLSNAPVVNSDKALLFLNPDLPESIATDCSLGAVVAPVITGNETSRIRETSPAKIVAVCAPSTIFQQPGSGREDLTGIVNLARNLPCYILEAGSRRDRIPETIHALITRLEHA